ncbi:MAG: DegT/DnrJ/EryC1/StrS family aminotransferase [Flavobacteriaceae bacterium]|nr:DegT/DnrJ/EryC1/StrS family aminotransferase [Flavobacteriaceae bacterium]
MIPFSPPRIDQKIIDEVTDTLRSGWITTGSKTKRFEKELTAYTGCKATLCLNSATAGLEIMLRWLGVKEGDEVIVPAYTYSATANVVVHCGAKPVFVDVLDDFNIDPEKIRAAITPHTKVIMPVDFGGLPCDYEAINAIALESQNIFKAESKEQEILGRIMVLSDAAHSIGGIYQGKKVGSLTDVSVISFHAVKNLTTAEGGCINLNLPAPFDNEEIYKSLCIKTLHGQDKDALAKTIPGNWRYDIVEAGYKCNMTDIMASIGLVELARYDNDTLPVRKAIVDRYQVAFEKFDWAELPVIYTAEKTSSYHLYPLRIKGVTEAMRDEIMSIIFTKGVSVNVHFIPVPMMSFYKGMGYDVHDYPNTFFQYSREFSLPIFYNLSAADTQTVIDAVISSVEAVLKKYGLNMMLNVLNGSAA